MSAPGGGGDILPEKKCGTLPEMQLTLTLIRTKSDFLYPVSDLIKNVIRYFRPDAVSSHETDFTNFNGSVKCFPLCSFTYRLMCERKRILKYFNQIRGQKYAKRSTVLYKIGNIRKLYIPVTARIFDFISR